MTEIKCKNCGGNQFKNKNVFKELIECEFCGTQYEKKVSNIEEDLPEELKVELKGDMTKFKVNNAFIRGDMNKVIGNFNIVIGNMNKVRGEGNIVDGDMNSSKPIK